jgi:hypothetical protein
VLNCKNREGNEAKPWPYRDQDIEIRKTYLSKQAWTLASVQLTGWRCDGPTEDTAASSEGDNAFALRWYAVEPKGAISLVGAGIWLVDAGDYDNDGKSELVFTCINQSNAS